MAVTGVFPVIASKTPFRGTGLAGGNPSIALHQQHSISSSVQRSSSGRRTLSDDRLVALAREGDHEAFRLIVTRYQRLVEATVTGILGSGSEAEDVGQETFIRFYRSLDQFRGDSSIGTYLTRIATNLSLNALRRWHRRNITSYAPAEIQSVASGHATDDLQRIDAREQGELVHKAIQALKPKLRVVVTLRLMNGYSTRETAEILQIPEGTVLSRLSRAQVKLTEMLHPILRSHDR